MGWPASSTAKPTRWSLGVATLCLFFSKGEGDHRNRPGRPRGFPRCRDNTHSKGNGFTSPSIVLGRTWLQECEGARHWHPELDLSRQMNTGAQLTSFFHLGSKPRGWCRPLSGWVFPPQLNLSGNFFVERPRGVSPRRFQNPVKLTVRIDCQGNSCSASRRSAVLGSST